MKNAPPATVIMTRPGFESALEQEIREKCGPERIMDSPGIVAFYGTTDHPALIFERQRMTNASFVPDARLKPISLRTFQAIMGPLLVGTKPWCILACAADAQNAGAERRLEGIINVLERLARKQKPVLLKLKRKTPVHLKLPEYPVLQLTLADGGMWHAVSPVGELIDPNPGGVRRMNMHTGAPSRSYLKIEEVFNRLGYEPQAGDRVIDLGAAPGGWTFSCLNRGCHVTAVDNGPMSVEADPATGATLTHLREDGLRFRPTEVVDWMISDMLVPPGKALGVLRNWLEKPWCKWFACNIKIPQKEAYEVLKPLEAYLSEQNLARCEIRQLYHDRREVTVFGRTGSGN